MKTSSRCVVSELRSPQSAQVLPMADIELDASASSTVQYYALSLYHANYFLRFKI